MKRNKTTYVVLAILLGGVGAHKFYAGKYVQGIFYILLLPLCFLPVLIGIIEGLVALNYTKEQYMTLMKAVDPEAKAWYMEQQLLEQQLKERLERVRIEEEEKAQREKLEAEERVKRERLRELTELYGDYYADLVMKKRIEIGMPIKAVLEVKGHPDDMKQSVTADTVKWKLYFGETKNSRGTVRYSEELQFENDKLTGWKDL